MIRPEHNEPNLNLPEPHLHSLVKWHSERAEFHQRMVEACIAELALRGLIVTEEVI